MANRPPSPDGEAWRTSAQRDFLAYQLLRMAHAAMSSHFDEETDAESEYAAWLAAEKRRKGGGKPKQLVEWEDQPEQGWLRLTALPTANTFSASLTHPRFAAEVTFTYDLEIEELAGGSIRQCRGDIGLAIAAAGFWVDELSEFDLSGLDEADLSEMLSGLEEDADDADGDELTDDSDEIDSQLQELADQMADQMREGVVPEISDEDRAWLDGNPELLWPILRQTIGASRAQPRDDHLASAWLLLLNEQLEVIRYGAERGHDWAKVTLDRYQDHLIEQATQRKLSHDTLFPLVTALGHAKVAVKPELTEALMRSGPTEAAASMPTEQALAQAVRPLIDEMARSVDSPFEVLSAMAETATILPGDVRSFIAHELALSPHAVMRDAVPLMLLDAAPDVRRSAALALEQAAAPDTLSPVSLRRVIAMRNWLPEADRPGVDQVIRKARTKGVEPAQWPSAPDLVARASPVDGSGAQSMVFTTKSGRAGLFAGLLLKQGFGIRDSWCDLETPRREIASAVSGLQRKMPAPEIDRAYVDVAVQNAIAAGVAAGHPPEPDVLQIAEAINGADWKDRALDVAGETERLFGELPADQTTATAIAASLGRMATWMDRNPVTDSWFEDDAEVRDFLQPLQGQDVAAASRALLDGMFGERRGVWAERFLLTALWARAVRPGQPPPLGASPRGMSWRDLVMLAHEVLSGRPLHEVPVMAAIASRTVEAARQGW